MRYADDPNVRGAWPAAGWRAGGVSGGSGLRAPLDVFVVRKLGVPGHRELAMGAIASGGVRVLNSEVVQALRISEPMIECRGREEQQELERQQRAYRGDASVPGSDRPYCDRGG